MNLPFGGAKGGIACDPALLTHRREGTADAPLHRGGAADHRPAHGRDGPRPGHRRADDGLDHDTYRMKVGYACPEIVTGKPVELGGCVGRREATGRGVVYCILEALDELNIDAEPGDGRRAGLRQRRLGDLPGAGPARREDHRRRRPLRGDPQPDAASTSRP